jgi:hypothetical protein
LEATATADPDELNLQITLIVKIAETKGLIGHGQVHPPRPGAAIRITNSVPSFCNQRVGRGESASLVLGLDTSLTGRAKTSARRKRFDFFRLGRAGFEPPVASICVASFSSVLQSDGHERLKPVRLIPYQAFALPIGGPEPVPNASL